MIAREVFVGTIISGLGMEEQLLVEFAGEGSTAVVYAVAPVERPNEAKTVLKFFKPQAFLEMEVLHYSLRVHEALYPKHPLIMPPDHRLKLLTDEMVRRARSPRCEFRVDIFMEILEGAISGLAGQYSKLFVAGRFRPEMLLEDPALAPRIDENLLYRIGELVEEDNIVEEFLPFFEYLVDAIGKLISQRKREGLYSPFSSNVLYNLLGLKLADFINDEELDHIAGSTHLDEFVTSTHLNDLWQFGTILYHQSGTLLKALSEERDDVAGKLPTEDELKLTMQKYDRERKDRKIEACVRGAMTAFKLVHYFSSRSEWDSSSLRGRSLYWYGKTVGYLQGSEQACRRAFESALNELTRPDDLADRHDLLLDMCRVLKDDATGASLAFLREAQDIEEKLKVPAEYRTREV